MQAFLICSYQQSSIYFRPLSPLRACVLPQRLIRIWIYRSSSPMASLDLVGCIMMTRTMESSMSPEWRRTIDTTLSDDWFERLCNSSATKSRSVSVTILRPHPVNAAPYHSSHIFPALMRASSLLHLSSVSPQLSLYRLCSPRGQGADRRT